MSKRTVFFGDFGVSVGVSKINGNNEKSTDYKLLGWSDTYFL